MNKILTCTVIGLSSLAVFSGCSEVKERVEFTHIHGLGFTADGEKAYIPAHDGLRVFEGGEWRNVEKGEGNLHDFMGFTMTSEGFYSSGHPSIQSDYKNPFGLIKSLDEGESLELLNLEGEVDFHIMSASYNANAIYVMNPEPNSKMNELSLYRTLDEGEEWEQSNMNGVEGDVLALAAHPDQEDIVALSTEYGLYISEDAGNTFENLIYNVPVPALTFTHTGEILLAEGIGGGSKLKMINLSGEERVISTPTIEEEDAISYLSQNPQAKETILITTHERDIFYTENQGDTWEKQAKNGLN